MAYDSVRAQLDKLLGADRNGPLAGGTSAPVSYGDATVCKNYLLGFCPHDLYIKHRSEPGSCPNQHLPAAREAFEKDRAAGRASGDAARWTRDLFIECRSIVDDEERRIRAHARRLQESYSASGPLSGLMIRSFDTLKKLGMVSQDAKIRILSEMDDLDDSLGAQLAPEDSSKDAAQTENAPAATELEALRRDESSPKNDAQEHSDHENPADDDVDDDDFGVIAVIPASDNAEVKPDASTSSKPAEKASEYRQGQRSSGAGTDLESAATTVVPHENDNDNDKKPTVMEEASESPSTADRQQPEDGGEPAEKSAGEQENLDKEATADPDEALVSRTEPEDKMEEFYRKGVGPDGLMMLTRKQSLRVCACCGGFISLVDAESRLLSHYGGKSHHSLVQLREKVAELEKTAAAERGFVRDVSPRDYRRGRRDERETNWSRGDERRPRHWDARDHGRGRRERDADYGGYGSVDWHHSSYRRRGDRSRDGGHRSRQEERLQQDRHSGRYGHGRKRNRSTSPMRSNRRQRYRS